MGGHIDGFYPIFLGGVNVGSGNKPPWTLPAKKQYGNFETARAKKYFGLTDMETPEWFPPLSLLPQRALCYIKANFSNEIFENTLLAIFKSVWIPPHKNITIPALMIEMLKETGLFSEKEVEEIMQAVQQKEWKDKLTANTQKVLDQGAFGAPWFMVTNGKGIAEPFFGSDRFHHMWEFLEIPWQDIAIIPKDQENNRGAKL
ncbi:hypothetical protein B7463_g10113, partial [Scytalidium lignicola]